jgi:hypothetical protein
VNHNAQSAGKVPTEAKSLFQSPGSNPTQGEIEMEESRNEQGRTLVINITLTRGVVAALVAVLLLVAFVGYLALGEQDVSASPAVPEAPAAPAASSGLRKYYRTSTSYPSTEVLTACATGYHFASIWELLDVSNLEYAGEHSDAEVPSGWDVGEGPFTGATDPFAGPSGKHGWIRTGYGPNTTPGVAGHANCNVWTSVSSGHYGTTAGLSWEWGVAEDIFVWDVAVAQCDYATGVWCVED